MAPNKNARDLSLAQSKRLAHPNQTEDEGTMGHEGRERKWVPPGPATHPPASGRFRPEQVRDHVRGRVARAAAEEAGEPGQVVTARQQRRLHPPPFAGLRQSDRGEQRVAQARAPARVGEVVQLQGTRGATDRLEVTVSLNNGQSYKIIDKLMYAQTRP